MHQPRPPDVTVVTSEGDTEEIVDVVEGDASAALALFRAAHPNKDDYRAGTPEWEDAPPGAEEQVRVFLARHGFEPVHWVRVALTYPQLYEN